MKNRPPIIIETAPAAVSGPAAASLEVCGQEQDPKERHGDRPTAERKYREPVPRDQQADGSNGGTDSRSERVELESDDGESHHQEEERSLCSGRDPQESHHHARFVEQGRDCHCPVRRDPDGLERLGLAPDRYRSAHQLDHEVAERRSDDVDEVLNRPVHLDHAVGVVGKRVSGTERRVGPGHDRVRVSDPDPGSRRSDRRRCQQMGGAAERYGRFRSDPDHERQRRVCYAGYQVMHRSGQRGARVDLDDGSRCARQGGSIDPVGDEVECCPVEIPADLDYFDGGFLVVGHHRSRSRHDQEHGDHGEEDGRTELHGSGDDRWVLLPGRTAGIPVGVSAESLQWQREGIAGVRCAMGSEPGPGGSER